MANENTLSQGPLPKPFTDRVSCLNDAEKRCLVEDIINLLGGGIRSVEITESAWCTLIKFAVEEYVLHIQDWLIEVQWTNLVNKDLTMTDVCFALTTRGIDYELQLSQAFSKQVGLGARSPYELKKDFVQLEEGRQVYEIPAGREVNRVLWVTPSEIDHATFASLGFGNLGFGGFGGGFGAIGFNGGTYGLDNGAYYLAPAYDVLLRGADFNLKNRFLQSDLTYKITAGPNGTKLLHLFNRPNDRTSNNTGFGHSQGFGARKHLYRCKVWYHYYDTSVMNAEELNECLNKCDDIVRFPSDVPLTKMDFCNLNEPSRIWVRKYMTALAKETLGRSRGKFGGKVLFPEADLTMDYESLLAEGKEEKDKLVEDLKTKLEALRPDKQYERKASEVENLQKILSKSPDGMFYI